MFFHSVKNILQIALISAIIIAFNGDFCFAIPTIQQVNYEILQGRELVTIKTNGTIQLYRSFMLENPPRLVMDIERVSNRNIHIPATDINANVRLIRFGHFNETTSRIVLELDANASRLEHHIAQTSNSLQIQIKGKNQIIKAARVAPAPNFAPIPRHKPSQNAGAANHGLPTIVIDAGHGGKDPGALGQSKTYEKNITLRYALHLRDHLKSLGRYNVVMTRSNDEFIFLHDRVKIARNNGGDLFISLHADSATETSARGISVYTVSEQASDIEAEILAAQENASDAIGGIKFAEDNPEVADILIDLASRDTRIKSTELALSLTKKFQSKGLNLLKNPNRFAGFRVLKSPDIPSVLIELGFLSNPQDDAKLRTKQHMQQVSSGITEAIQSYLQQHPRK
jgi:N-acetylmuramoyl-L-alanine amidase